MDFKRILVVGAGTMGAGIAQWFSQQGVGVELFDLNEDFAKKAHEKIELSWDKLLARQKFTPEEVQNFKASLKIVTSHNISPSPDLLIEAIVENLAVKKDFFLKMHQRLHPSCLFASNTSSFPMTLLCENLPPERRKLFMGLHFFNPPTIMKLVEVIGGKWTPTSLIEKTARWFDSKGKKAAICKESPGFIVNRVARNFYGEALKIADSDQLEHYQEIDHIMKKVGGLPMGPFELMDLIGIDVNYSVTESVWQAFDKAPRFAPHPLQKLMVESGRLGKKSNKGFYQYE